MNNKDKREFFEKFTGRLDERLDNELVGHPNELWQWVESKKERWELIAFHDGYQTRCDEDEMINRPVRSDKAGNIKKSID